MKMRGLSFLAAAAVSTFLAGTANATLIANSQVQLTSTVGTNNNYTITVTNAGTDNIGTFWFAWTPPGQPIEYSFLPTAPSAASGPTGWIAPIVSGFPGSSIEFYNVSGNPILPTQSATFHFTTTDSPSTLQGTVFGFPIATSFIYAGFPEGGATAQVTPTFLAAAPEPASVGALGIVGLALLRRRRR